MKETAIIYCRVSSTEQVSGTSLQMQEKECRKYAERLNIDVLKCYVEEGESAKTANRTKFKEALAFCTSKKNRVNYFIVHKVDRFARNQDDHAMTRAMLDRYGVRLRSVTEPIDETPMGKAMGGMLSVFAELDNNIRALRSKSGMVERVKQGVWIWPAPLGYTRLSEGGNLVLDDKTAPYVRIAFEEWAKGGHTFKSLAKHMSDLGLRTRTGKKPMPQLMEKMLRNPIYYGLIKAEKWDLEVKGNFPPIIDEGLFLRCQPRSRNGPHSTPRLKESPHFPLRHFVICPECSTPLTGSASRGRHGKRYPYYHHQKAGCPASTYVPAETFEQNFVEFLKGISPKIKSEKIFKEIVIDVWQSNYRKLDAKNGRVRSELEKLEAERQKVFDLHKNGVYDDGDFIEQKRLVNERISEKKLLLEEMRVEEFDMEEALSYCFDFVRESAKTWTELADLPSYRRRFQKQAFPEKVVFDGEKFGTPKMSLVYELNQSNTPKKSDLVRVYRAARTHFQSRSD